MSDVQCVSGTRRVLGTEPKTKWKIHEGKFPHRTAVFPLCPQLGASHLPTALSDPCPTELLFVKDVIDLYN